MLTQGRPQFSDLAGDGSTHHLDQAVDLPGEIELQDGVYEVGREEPADVVIPVPTVSGRHALLRISKQLMSPLTMKSVLLYLTQLRSSVQGCVPAFQSTFLPKKVLLSSPHL